MKKLTLLAFALFSTAAVAQSPEIIQMNQEMITPTVQISAGDGIGSGTVIKSKEGKTFVLTNHHVVADAYKWVDEVDDENGKKKKVRKEFPVNVIFHVYKDTSRLSSVVTREARVTAYDSVADLALVLVDDEDYTHPAIAKLAPANVRIDMGEQVWASGGGLGFPPFLSSGVLGHNHFKIEGRNFLLATSAIAPGNSGGGLYRKGATGYELIGVPSRGATRYGHIGFAIPVSQVRSFLTGKAFEF
jgi:S1-C subfamily serine protease